ncbi:TPA: 23S rRNA (pseudouridine(1915)-N(3))-methyltransferase RlmH [Legionella pneumophila subsp. pneumophila]|uniref:23S rRNA (pseudouridine(1915)-N(3))-methyltransferase RlmH n=1 Tax=Legionella pneumophila TaxID=446 RepID=UPI0001E3C35B|nr:23S rRNA (pseudouridine(1915)-N(3))-methyltransferase RlmH [Legionella pneumophila]MDC8028901.1 23S rRNA (pseudouridine(1915)-N(3))-methyltransferase RlmH [Legionella pneumophila subsp. pneumophila]MDW8869315.1 23S rRNA (pseudouridine(1915)-N(3))-methyltransferase RlmH [Legionella pneumophila]MDW8915325.1 23S rRNA (pseudouridine(1915)-N(3))-methyltransferase RlmH [Legionella pneumophila]MDW8923658.1 23S rRNA (pseudouridine(1915)-N(3))-methyltransferase RlmH [Legionella pneumophila]MDW893112
MLKITIITLGNKMPDWVNSGVNEYAKRFHDGIQIKLIEIPLLRRNKSSDLARILEKESALTKDALPANARLIALDMLGKSFSSVELALRLTQLQQISSHLCFIIGGPEGLSNEILTLCDERWSLSKLTLPHPLVRIILLESLYRAWSIINNHPYHK